MKSFVAKKARTLRHSANKDIADKVIRVNNNGKLIFLDLYQSTQNKANNKT